MITTTEQRSTAPTQRVRGARAGLDIGAHSAKLVICRWRNGSWRIINAHSLPLPAGCLADPIELAKTLNPWLTEQNDLRSCELIGALTSMMVDYETVDLEPTAEADIARFAEASLRELLGEQRSQATCDYWCGSAVIAGQRTNQLHLAWTGNDFAAKLSQQLSRIAGRFQAIDSAASATARLAYGSAPRPKSALVVDIGDGEVSLIWTHNALPHYIRNRIRFAPHSAAVELTQAWDISEAAAQTLLDSWGMGDPRIAPSGPLEAAIEQHLADWLQKLGFEITRTIQFLQHRYGAAAVPEIVLCGGGACIRGLARCLGCKLNVSVRNATLAPGWVWEAAEPYSPLFAQAVALTHYGEPT